MRSDPMPWNFKENATKKFVNHPLPEMISKILSTPSDKNHFKPSKLLNALESDVNMTECYWNFPKPKDFHLVLLVGLSGTHLYVFSKTDTCETDHVYAHALTLLCRPRGVRQPPWKQLSQIHGERLEIQKSSSWIQMSKHTRRSVSLGLQAATLAAAQS